MRTTFAAVAFALAVAGSAFAEHDCVPTTSEPEVTVGEGPAVFYLDNDTCMDCLWSIWLYMESNGIPGLQRDDDTMDDTCGGQIESDTVIF